MGSTVYYGKVSKKDIAYIRFIFEGYEDIGNVRTLDSVRGFVEFIISPHFDEDFHYILDALKKDIFIELIDKPEGYESMADVTDDSTKYS